MMPAGMSFPQSMPSDTGFSPVFQPVQQDFDLDNYIHMRTRSPWQSQPMMPPPPAPEPQAFQTIPENLPLFTPMPVNHIGLDSALMPPTRADFVPIPPQNNFFAGIPTESLDPSEYPPRFTLPEDPPIQSPQMQEWSEDVTSPSNFDSYSPWMHIGAASPALSTFSFGNNSIGLSPLFSDNLSDIVGNRSLHPTPSTTPVSVLSIGSGQIFPTPAGTPSHAEAVLSRTTTPSGNLRAMSNPQLYRSMQSPFAPPPVPPPSRIPSRSQMSPFSSAPFSPPPSLSRNSSCGPGSMFAPPPRPPSRVSTPASMHPPPRPHTRSPRSMTPFAAPPGSHTYICDICSKRFSRVSDLGKHRRYHTKDQACHFTSCNAVFSTRKDLNRHINSTHAPSTGHVCRVKGCGKHTTNKVYNRADNFLRHLKTAHAGIDIDYKLAVKTWVSEGNWSDESPSNAASNAGSDNADSPSENTTDSHIVKVESPILHSVGSD